MVALEKPDGQASLAQALPADPIQGPSWAVMGGRAYYVLRDGEKRTLCVVACPADANTETPFPKGLAPMGDLWVQACPPHKPVKSHSLVYKEPQSCISQCCPKTECTASGGGELPLTGGVQAKAE